MDFDDLSAVIKACRNAKRLILGYCAINPPGILDFNIQEHYNIQFLSFWGTGWSNCSDWENNKTEFEDIIKAMNSSGLQQSIQTLDLKDCLVDISQVTVGTANVQELDYNIQPMKYS